MTAVPEAMVARTLEARWEEIEGTPAGSYGRQSRATSTAGAEWVSAPTAR